jgi:hypothetical protein
MAVSRYTSLACALLLIAVSSCAPQNDESSEIAGWGCHVDLKKVCQAFISQPDDELVPFHLDAKSIERAPRYVDAFLPSPVVTLKCGFDTRHKTVTDASLGRQIVTEKKFEEIRAMGFCTDDPEELQKAVEREEERLLRSADHPPKPYLADQLRSFAP